MKMDKELKRIVQEIKSMAFVKQVSSRHNKICSHDDLDHYTVTWNIYVVFTDGMRVKFRNPDRHGECKTYFYHKREWRYASIWSYITDVDLPELVREIFLEHPENICEDIEEGELDLLKSERKSKRMEQEKRKLDLSRKLPIIDYESRLMNMEQKNKLQESLRAGYPTQGARLLRWFFYDQPDSGIRKVLVEVNQKEVARERRDIRIERRKREGTPRVLGGRLNCEILYPSGRRYWGRVHVVEDLAVIEPDKPDTAAWVLNREDVEFDKVVDLRKLTYTRVIHNKVGINFLKQIIRS